MAKTLREIRESRRLKQYELARKAGLNTVVLGRIERGERGPHLATFLALWRALGGDCGTFTDLYGFFTERSDRQPIAPLRERMVPAPPVPVPGTTLRQARESAGLSQEALARFLELDAGNTYWYLENSDQVPRLETFFRLWELYGGDCAAFEWLRSVFEPRLQSGSSEEAAA
jgi:transcriptional regulator with XRE-family HTH domain